MDLKITDGMALYNDAITRIQQLEQLNATLAAEVDRLRREYDEEVTEFNDGYEAAEQGLPDTSEPSDMKHDVWKCGYAWGMYSALVEQVNRMRSVVVVAVVLADYGFSVTRYNDLQTMVDQYRDAMAALTKGKQG